jgi:sec-independent protein translocase protein TatB
MFGLSTTELMIILVVALLILGPSKLPEAAKSIGKGLRQITKATEDVRQQMNQAMYEDEKPRAAAAPKPAPPAEGTAAAVPPGGVPPAASAPVASAQNVPGLDAALAEPAPQPAVPRAAPSPAGAVAPDGTHTPKA